MLNMSPSPEEEVGSAGEQPTSNRTGSYTIKGQLLIKAALPFIGKRYG